MNAERIIRQLPEQIQDKKGQEIVIDLLINLLMNKLPPMLKKGD